MKIAMVAGPWLPVPPTGYGGAELVVSQLADGLVERGHEVLLFAAGDSRTKAQLIPIAPKHIGQDWPGYGRPLQSAFSEYSFVRSFLEKVDIIHDHTMHHNTWLPVKTIYTLHGPAEWGAELARRMSTFGQPNYFVPISNTQRRLYGEEGINFIQTVYNGIDVEDVPFSDKKEGYLFFIGRASWEKGLDLAVRIAIKTKRKLKMAIKMTEAHEKEYFRKTVKPLLPQGDIEIMGDVTMEQKFDLYKNAYATLFTSQWEEPFGLVMIESMATGTPVIALKRGAAVEVIKDGVNGFLGDSLDDLVDAVGRIPEINASACRQYVEENFSVDRMVEGYEEAYKTVLYGAVKAVIARDVMTTEVITVTPQTSRDELIRVLARHDISGVPVISDGKLVGIVTEDDILAKAGDTVNELMSKNVITVNEKDPVHRVASILIRNRVKRVPVMSDSQLIGIISRHDLVHALAIEKPMATAM
ncbi:MAG TPA: CBS domain-containing protein [Anaerolineae bacterium]|jgi:glycosyltransferase involved in cell wall biosynthesis|nr:CBS domain-containing protein [Anaerolineae bacterium]